MKTKKEEARTAIPSFFGDKYVFKIVSDADLLLNILYQKCVYASSIYLNIKI